MKLRLGELCAGYGGLGMAVEDVFNADAAWFSEFDEAPSKILAHHWPHVPNYGDMTKIDWAAIEPVNIISGGTPCQDLSGAGKRAGMTEGTRSNLWVQMREAIAIQKPTYVVWENVRGAYSAKADSDLEQCPGCMGDTRDGGVVLRALGRVLGDLSDLGYDCQWRGIRAADVGACHGRFRVFVLAVRRAGLVPVADPDDWRGSKGHHGNQRRRTGSERTSAVPNSPDSRPGVTEDTNVSASGKWRQSAPRQAESGRTRPDTRGRSGASAADSDSGHDAGREQNQEWGTLRGAAAERVGGSSRRRETTSDTLRGGSGGRPTEPGSPRRHYAVIGSGTRGSWARAALTNARSAALREHPTGPFTEEAWAGSCNRSGDHRGERTAGNGLAAAVEWGPYTPAIRRWEAVRGTAPSPTELTAKGNYRLSARFAEWMMGLPSGWVTDPAIGLTRNEQLKACGNGVVPQQASAALRDMLAAFQLRHPAAA